jgi:TldD protein
MRVDQYDQVVEVLRKEAASRGIFFVARFQDRKDLTVHLNNGKTEEINSATLVGIGLQVISDRGFMGFAAADRISEPIALELLEKAAFLAEQGQYFSGESNREVFKLTSLRRRLELTPQYPYGSLSLQAIEAKIKELNRELVEFDERLSVRSVLRLTDEEWRIIRSDGTDVQFNTPRSFVYHSLTAKSTHDTATTYANLPGTDLGIIIEPRQLERLNARAKKAANLALNLLDAKKIPAGTYKLVIDYALAKGLAHEAFGHAAETDALESSILGENGRMKVGLTVADPRLSIVDGPIAGDYAYQPISAMGIERKTVRIVDKGKLTAGLSDIFSAERSGVPLSGAERVESFFHLPIARMTNIRIEFENSIEVNQPFESITPSDLYRIITENQLAEPGEKVLYLTGFQGGQVNPSFGDFVFHCSGIYELSEQPVLFKPAIFSGSVLSVLQSVSAAIGPPQIDAMGTCGKMGQGVPSCGGSHYFLIIEANPEIKIGGE